VVEELVTINFQGSFALAGRNLERLELIAAAAGVPNAPIIIADVHDPESLKAMASQARVVITVVGPYRYWGEPVVAACVEAGTDCLDISGEPEYIEKIEYEYNEKAKQNGCFIASAVGFDSVPGDVGAYWTASQFHPPARCTAIETFISIHGGSTGFQGHFPTFESAVQGFAHAKELSNLRKKAAQARGGGRIDLKIPGPKLKIDTTTSYEPRVNAWKLPFMGSDASVVKRTTAALAAAGKPAYHSAVYLTLPSRYATSLFTCFGAIFMFLAKKSWGRKLLLSFPRFFTFGMFSHEGPSPQQMAETSFEMINFAQGYSQGGPSSGSQDPPDMKLTTRVAGPEPGYIACSIFVVAAAVTLVEEREKLGVAPGVHTPAFLFQNTSYVDKLKARGIVFEVLTEQGVENKESVQ
jgi:short subunit dehydrogenase-like uncharacterized protein